MEDFFLELLINPNNNNPLSYDAMANELTDGKARFSFIKNVPILLVKTEDNYQQHYEKDAVVFDYFTPMQPDHFEENRRLHQQIIRQIPDKAETILDVGCGGAWVATEMIPKGKKVISMDISTTNPTRAVQLIDHKNHLGLVADVYSAPIKPNSIDCIIAAEIIEHVNDPSLFISCLYKLLTPGGKLIVSTPHNEKIQHSLCIHCNKLTPHNAHLHSFTPQSIAAIAPALACKNTTLLCNSKWLIKTRVYMMLKNAPFTIWNLLDKGLNMLSGKWALRLLLISEK